MKPALSPHKNFLLNHHFLLAWCMHIQNNDISPATSQNYIWQPIANKLYCLNCWYYSVVYKTSCSQLIIFISFSKEKIIIPCSYLPPLSQLTSCTPSKSNLYLANSLAAAVREPALSRLLTFQVLNLISLFRCLGRTKVSVQLVQFRGFFCEYFVIRYVFTVRSS